MAQAGIVKENFTDLCDKTGTAPMDIPASQLDGMAVDAGADNFKLVMLTPDVNAEAVQLVGSWDKSNMIAEMAEDDETVQIFSSPIEGTDKVECALVITSAGSPMTLIYMEGDSRILDSINVAD